MEYSSHQNSKLSNLGDILHHKGNPYILKNQMHWLIKLIVIDCVAYFNHILNQEIGYCSFFEVQADNTGHLEVLVTSSIGKCLAIIAQIFVITILFEHSFWVLLNVIITFLIFSYSLESLIFLHSTKRKHRCIKGLRGQFL